MLKGNLECSEIKKYLIEYINFELNRKEAERISLHIRNCPKCMEIYTALYERKRKLKEQFGDIEKKIVMKDKISAYIDNEAQEKEKHIIEQLIMTDKSYKKEFLLNKKMSEYLNKAKNTIINRRMPQESLKIIEKIKTKKKISDIIVQHFELLHHVFLKY